jgi:hypothetical protein
LRHLPRRLREKTPGIRWSSNTPATMQSPTPYRQVSFKGGHALGCSNLPAVPIDKALAIFLEGLTTLRRQQLHDQL